MQSVDMENDADGVRGTPLDCLLFKLADIIVSPQLNWDIGL